MKKISNDEFKYYIERVLNKEISLTDLAKELETTIRTLHEKIQKMFKTDPELYDRYVLDRPYRQKKCTSIDFEALTIYMIKEQLTQNEAADLFGISTKTISRRINDLREKNSALIDIYESVIKSRRKRKKIPISLQERINNLPTKNFYDVIKGKYNENKKKELLQLKEEFEKNIEIYGSKKAATNAMGKSYTDIYKLLQTLNRILIEEEVLEKKQMQKDNFKKDLKVEGINEVVFLSENNISEENIRNQERVD